MKQKKQRKKLIQGLAIALGVALLGVGLWSGINEEKLQASPKVEDWQPISEYTSPYGVWKNSLTDYIPKENAFSIKYIPGQTKVTAVTSGVAYDVDKQEATNDDTPAGWNRGKEITYINFTKEPTQSVTFSNIGFYEGESLGLKVIFTAIDLKGSAGSNIGPAFYVTDSITFLNFILNFDVAEEFQIDYQFLDADGNEKSVNSMWNIASLFRNKNFVFDTDSFTNVYTLPTTGFAEPCGLMYDSTEKNDGIFSVNGTLAGSGATKNERSEMTVILPNKSGFRVTARNQIRPASGVWQVSYSPVSTAKVQFPDPQTTNNSYSEIIDAGKKGLLSSGSEQIVDTIGYQFIQQVPAELRNDSLGVNHRTQTPTWILKPQGVADTLQPTGGEQWNVSSLDEPTLNPTILTDNWFTYHSANKQLEVTDNTLVSSSGSKFYNHYYVFQKDLEVNYNQPMPSASLTADYTYDFHGGVVLNIQDTNPPAGVSGWNGDREEQAYSSKLNFKAPITYKYFVKEGDKIEEMKTLPSGALTSGEGIVTWQVPLSPIKLGDSTLSTLEALNGDDPAALSSENEAPLLNGYSFVSAKLNGQATDWQLKETKRTKTGNPSTNASDYSENNVVELVYEEDEPWLPYYKPGLGIGGGGWLDSMESYIPRENAFSIRYMEGKTKVTKVSDGVWFDPSNQTVTQTPDGWDWPSRYHTEENPDGDIDENTMVPIDFSDSPTQSIEFANVAYYNGENIGLKVTLTQINPVTPQPTNPTYKYGPAIGVKPFPFANEVNKPKTFLIFYTNFELAESYQIEYEFLDTAGNPLSVGSNFTTTGVYIGKEFKIKSDSFENIYSLPRSSDLPVLDGAPVELQYEELANNWLSIIGTNQSGSSPYLLDPRGEFTTTFNGSKYLIQASPTNSAKGFAVYYGSKGLVKTEIPDPQATSQIYTEIIGAGKGITDNDMIDPFNYGFIQQMPWESQSPKDNRTQIPTWTLTAPAGSTTFTQSEWQVQSQDDPDLGGGDVYDWFTATGNDLTPAGGLTGKLADDDFYNHYYKFNRGLTIDYHNPITKDTLTAKDAGYYYDFSNKVELNVDDTNPTAEQTAGMNKNREEVKYDTAINFYAPLEYKYINSVTGAEIPADSLPDSAKPTGDGIVTWDAPLTPQVLTDTAYTQATGQGEAPVIAGYQFDRSELNGDEAETQIQVTKLLRPDTLKEKALERAVDADDPANYTQNNIVTLYYTPVSYDVAIEVTKPNGDTLEANANSYFELSNDDGVTWTPVSGYDFTAGNTYQIRQKAAVSPYYNPADTSPTFTVRVNEDGDFELTATDDDTYSFIRTELTDDKKLIIKVINQPSGDIVLSQVAPLDYGTVQVPRKDRTIKRVDPDWTINFEDNRPPETGNQLHFYVTLTKEFTDQDGAETRTLPSILAFIDEPGEITANDFLVKDAQVPIQTIELPQYGADSLTWSADAGFLLQLDKKAEAKLNVGQDQKYRAELTFTLAADPL